jgi:hypothetical protein
LGKLYCAENKFEERKKGWELYQDKDIVSGRDHGIKETIYEYFVKMALKKWQFLGIL